MTPDDRQAIDLYRLLATLGPLGLAPLVFQVADLQLPRREARALVERLALLARDVPTLAESRAAARSSSARGGPEEWAALVDTVEPD